MRNSEEEVPGNAERGGEFGFEAGGRVYSWRGGGNPKAREGSGDEEEKGGEEAKRRRNDGVGK